MTPHWRFSTSLTMAFPSTASGETYLHVTSLQAPAITRHMLSVCCFPIHCVSTPLMSREDKKCKLVGLDGHFTASQQSSAGSPPICSTAEREDSETSDAYKRLGTSSGLS